MEFSKASSFNPQTSCMEFLDIDSLYTFEHLDDETFNTKFEFGSESDTDDVQGTDDATLARMKSDPGNDFELDWSYWVFRIISEKNQCNRY